MKTFSLFAVFIIENQLILGLRCLVTHFSMPFPLVFVFLYRPDLYEVM